jgi:hypothetical protein
MAESREELWMSAKEESEVRRNWDTLVAGMEEGVAEINQGLPESLLLFSKPKEEEFDITNQAASMSVVVRNEPNGDLVYKGTAASGVFRAQTAGNELKSSWERTTSSPSMRVTFGSIGVDATLDEIGELIIRSVVTP